MRNVKNTTNGNWHILNDDGELLSVVKPDETVRIFSEAETERNENYMPKVIINKRKLFMKDMLVNEWAITKALIKHPTTATALLVLKHYVIPEYNTIEKNGKRYTKEDLAKDMEISRQSAYNHFAILEDLGVIAEIDLPNGRFYALNPYCYCRSEAVVKPVADAFSEKIV